jgi:hypothetical protein
VDVADKFHCGCCLIKSLREQQYAGKVTKYTNKAEQMTLSTNTTFDIQPFEALGA